MHLSLAEAFGAASPFAKPGADGGASIFDQIGVTKGTSSLDVGKAINKFVTDKFGEFSLDTIFEAGFVQSQMRRAVFAGASDTGLAMAERLLAEARTAKAGVFLEQRLGSEEEIPELKSAREAAISKAKFELAQDLNDTASEDIAMLRNQDFARGRARQIAYGPDSFITDALTTPEGRTDYSTRLLYEILSALSHMQTQSHLITEDGVTRRATSRLDLAEEQAIDEHREASPTRLLEQISESTRNQNELMQWQGNNPTLGHPDVDR